MNIADKSVASIHYTLKNDEGEVLDSSEGQAPLDYIQGLGNIIPGLENALAGKAAGDKVQVVVEAADGYGEYNAEMVQELPRTMFQGVDTIEVGMAFQAQTPAGMQVVEVIEVDDETVTIDGNHQLAGQRLHFDVEVVGVRAASDDELAHGHVHAEGGCGHDH
ncbi:FKBP-type peptidyl-prolyl cis-trans isomerase [Simiduia aestuariiviva]|uniref:Peptidyl-prolyl cis-trans isomerase n=1 Tax=Simiduia aestuariiviva TaxID=1510459 RepID=A0A839UUA4_9GAMM|nr:peptidylprolyl isomerase [Simiduia aestuariiviva]MBB3168957.1 FKBP-type peptidyl-prolyl cis-trans isomerase SlyD [Simiduia aestuariiviva]